MHLTGRPYFNSQRRRRAHIYDVPPTKGETRRDTFKGQQVRGRERGVPKGSLSLSRQGRTPPEHERYATDSATKSLFLCAGHHSLPCLRRAATCNVSAHAHACRLDIKSTAAIERASERVSEWIHGLICVIVVIVSSPFRVTFTKATHTASHSIWNKPPSAAEWTRTKKERS